MYNHLMFTHFSFNLKVAEFLHQAPVVQRPDYFIEWISLYPTVSICAKISVFPHQGKKLFFIPLVHWTSNVQILVIRKLNSLVRNNYLSE